VGRPCLRAVGAVVVFAIYRELGEGAVASLAAGGVTFLGIGTLGLGVRVFLSA
jgi:hypothetical protein